MEEGRGGERMNNLREQRILYDADGLLCVVQLMNNATSMYGPEMKAFQSYHHLSGDYSAYGCSKLHIHSTPVGGRDMLFTY